MKTTTSSFLFICVSFFTLLSWASERPSTALDSNISNTEIVKPWFVKVDGTALLLKGLGLGVGYNISPKFSGEIFYSQYTLEGEKFNSAYLGQYEATHKPKMYGIRLNALPLSDFDKGGWYVSAGLIQIDLKTEIDPVFSEDIQTLSTTKTGYKAYTGYMFRGGIFRTLSAAAIAGLGYGTGGSYKNNLGGSSNEITESLLVDLSVQMNF